MQFRNPSSTAELEHVSGHRAATVTIAGGHTSATFTITTFSVTTTATVNISATSDSVTKSKALTVTP